MSLPLGIHPNCWFVHKYTEAFSGSHHLCPCVSHFWLRDVLCSVFRNIVSQCTVLSKCLPLFLIFRQTYLWLGKISPGKKSPLFPLTLPFLHQCSLFGVGRVSGMWTKRVTLLGLWELSGKWAMASLRDGTSPVLFSCWIVMTCLLVCLIY